MKNNLWDRNLDDKELIEATLEGKDGTFRELIKRYEPKVAGTIIGMLGQCPEAEDVGQETFIRLYKNLKNFRGESNLGTYITRIAINLSLNELKRRKRKNMLFFRREDEGRLDMPDETPADPMDGNKELVHWAIQQLEMKFRSVIVLRLLEGYSTEETGEILNLPVGTVLSRLSRAQQKLKKLLLPYLKEMS